MREGPDEPFPSDFARGLIGSAWRQLTEQEVAHQV